MLREDEAAQRSTAATGRGSDRSSLGLPVAFHCHSTQRRSGMRAEDSIGQPWGRGSMSPQSQWRARCHARCHGDRLPAPSRSRQPGGPVPPPGANCVPCSFSPGLSAEPAPPAGRPGEQSRRRPPQPETSRKQGGNGSGGPPPLCPPRTGAAGSFFPPAAPGLGAPRRSPPTASPPLCKVLCGGRPGVSSLLLSLTLSSLSPRGHCQGWLAPLSLSPGLPRPCKSTCQQRRGAQESHVQEVFW